MSQLSRTKSAREAGKSAGEGETTPDNSQGKWTRIIIAAVVVIVILGIAVAAFYPTYIGPFRRTIITVDDTTIRMDYFLKISRLTGADPFNTLDSLAKQQIIKLEGPGFGISVPPEAIDQELRRQAQGNSENISDAEFKEWYRQKLNQSDLTDSEYREIIEVSLIAYQMQQILAAQVSTVAEQVHLYSLFTETEEEALEARARWEAGEDFSALISELSMDEFSREQGGELGWFPRGVLNAQFEFEAFALEAGEVSQPIPMMSNTDISSGQEPSIEGWSLFFVKDRAVARELDEQSLQVVRAAALDEWLTAEMSNHVIKYSGLSGNFDSETYAWIKYQLAKTAPETDQSQP